MYAVMSLYLSVMVFVQQRLVTCLNHFKNWFETSIHYLNLRHTLTNISVFNLWCISPLFMKLLQNFSSLYITFIFFLKEELFLKIK